MPGQAAAGDQRGDRQALSLAPLSAQIVYRQVLAVVADRMWAPTTRPGRWSDFPAIYTSLSLEVALTERLKRTGAARTDLVVAIADASLERVLDLTTNPALSDFGATVTSVSTDNYDIPQRIGRLLRDAAVQAAFVPAAIGREHRRYPRFVLAKRGEAPQQIKTPASGVNLVIFVEHARAHWFKERERFLCTIHGLPG